MAHHLQHIPDLAKLLFLHGVEDVVISPGSRNAPLIRAFHKQFGERCLSIVDERSAAYFALGQSLITKKPTVLISTSGTAVLNYAPAVAEAFYQGVPLLVITADRPAEWIGQQDNQAILQNNVFGKNVKAAYTLPVESSNSDSLWFAHRIINEAFHLTVSEKSGPVHINVPLREPLYEELPEITADLKIIKKEQITVFLNENSLFLYEWKTADSILIVSGQSSPDNKLSEVIKNIATGNRVFVIAEPVSNLHAVANMSNPEVVLNSKIEYPEIASPDLVIYFGGQLVSKKIKLFLRQLKGASFYCLSPDEEIVDTFQQVDTIIKADPFSVLKNLPVKTEGEKSDFKKFWEKELEAARQLNEKYFDKISFSDLITFKTISENLPENAIVFAGNSSAVRYLSYFDQQKRVFYSNRGTSGIDGCLSTAAGLASKINETVYAIVGDLSFVYDSNALWNRELPKNLKIILINNDGGGIFHLLKGPSESEAFSSLVNAHHPVDLKKLTEAFGLDYHCCAQESEIKNSIINIQSEKKNAEVLEIRTPNNGEPQITKDFFRFLNNNYGTELDND